MMNVKDITTKEKIRFVINQICITDCNGKADEDAIKAVRYLQEISNSIDCKLFEKLKIAFKYGIKVTEKHPDNNDCDDAYFDKAVLVINRIYKKGTK